MADILNEKFTLDDLVTHDKLKEQRKSLKTLIEEMEDEVLANAGVDVFEEVFKLIFTKLYDEWSSGQGNRRNTRQLEFRNTGQTETALRDKIQSLFEKAKQKWEGVFGEDSKITLTPSHLAVCVSSLEDVKLFNSNSELGLKDWQPTEENIAVKSFAESFRKSNRLDAEHYQPKYDQLIQKLKEQVKLTKLGKISNTCQKGKQPRYFDEDEEIIDGYPVINSKQVQKGEVILTNSRFAPLPDGKQPLVIQDDDVLINGTGVGTIGRCAPYLYEQQALPDTEVTVLRSNKLDSVYLSIYLNSILGQLQIEKYLQGSSGIIRVYPKDIAEFWIWEAPVDIQQSIRNKVEESHHKREQSKQLLEIAKTGVEKAIEENEEEATNWINKQLKELNINLSTSKENESN